jgi:steroid 5-alpha reductase family enzyme
MGSFLLMIMAWLLFLKVKNAAIIDVFWGLNIALIGSINLWPKDKEGLVLLAFLLLITWACRLSLYLLLTRVIKGKKDTRYESMAAAWPKKRIGFLKQYLLQGFLAWIIALPFFMLTPEGNLTTANGFAAFCIIVGLFGESLADWQLYRYKKSPQKAYCDIGLWRYSRHPNYFFECLLWFGFSLMGSSLGLGLLSFLSIITLFCIMWFVTIPLTEQQSLKHRAGYKEYVTRTKTLIPFFL